MDYRLSPLERAFELAKSGRCASIIDIRRKLRSEGYSAVQITGKSLSKQMKELISAARAFDQGQPVSSPDQKREPRPMKARQLLAEAALDPAQLTVLFRVFDLAWRKLAPEIGSDPKAMEVSTFKLANIVLAIGNDMSRIADPALLAETALKGYRVKTAPTPMKVATPNGAVLVGARRHDRRRRSHSRQGPVLD